MQAKQDVNDSPNRPLSRLEETILGVRLQDIPKLLPGLLLAAAITAIATWLTGFLSEIVFGLGKSPISAIMVAILIGLAVRNLAGLHRVFGPGVDFCVKKVLRLGIILMGIRLSVLEVMKIGVVGLPIVLVCVTTGLAFTMWMSGFCRLPRRLGVLIAVGTGICGASAIVATAPGIDASDEETAYAIATITVFGILAMLVYPFLAYHLFSANQVMSGLLLGTAIHETAQVTGAGLIYDSQFAPTAPTAADVAICVKLVRNALMAVVIPAMILAYRRLGADDKGLGEDRPSVMKLFPMFIVGFILLAVIRSVGDAGVQTTGLAFGALAPGTWQGIHQGMAGWAGHLLAVAMAGVGLNASYRGMRQLGPKPFCVGLLAALIVGLVAVVAAFAVGPSIVF